MTSEGVKPRDVELEAIEAALKRAAYKVVHGTREERSGRFLPKRHDVTLKTGSENPSYRPSAAETSKSESSSS
jgi:hypothetical protein